MIIKNVKIFTEDKTFKNGEIYIKGGIFVDDIDGIDEEIIDGKRL